MSKEIISKILIFAAGAAVGSAVTWKLVKTKYEEISKQEIESVIESFSNKEESDPEESKDPAVEPEKLFKVDPSVEDAEEKEKTIQKAQEIAARAGYFNYNDSKKEEEEEEAVNEPYVISPEEFGEEDYAIITFNYHTDGVVSDERGRIIANAEELLGKDFASHFGEYPHDPDTVYIRNDEDSVDYEILKDYRAYSELE